MRVYICILQIPKNCESSRGGDAPCKIGARTDASFDSKICIGQFNLQIDRSRVFRGAKSGRKMKGKEA